MKKFLSVLIIAISLFSLPINQTSFAFSKDSTIMESDYRELMDVIKSKVLDGWSEEEIKELPIVSDFENKYSEEQIAKFLYNEVEVFNKDKVQEKLSGIEIGTNEIKLIEFDDGSFMVFKSSIENLNQYNKITTPKRGMIGLSYGSTQGKSGDEFSVDNTVEYWGIYLAARAVLNTEFTIYPNRVNVERAYTAGSKANFPHTLDIHGTNISSNNTINPSTDATFTKTDTIGGTIPLPFSTTFTLITDVRILQTFPNGAIAVGVRHRQVE